MTVKREQWNILEYVEDPDEIHPPRRNFFLVVLCVEMPRNNVSLSLLDDLLLDLIHGPGARSKGSATRHPRRCVLGT